jgi:hypothetical protein
MRLRLSFCITMLAVACTSETPRNDAAEGNQCTGGHFTATDEADVTPKTEVDVLFVVDDSGTMGDDQAAFSAGIRAIIDEFDRPDADYRFAVTTTDLYDDRASGRFRNAPGVLGLTTDPATPPLPDCSDLLVPGSNPPRFDVGPILLGRDAAGQPLASETLAHRLECLLTVGNQGDAFEKGLEAMRLALSCDGPNASAFSSCCVPSADGRATYDPTCTITPAFLRPRASLAVIFVSDERDCSDPASNPQASSRVICRDGGADADADGVADAYAEPGACPSGDERACQAAECGDATPEACHAARCVIERGDNNNCAWFPDALTQVSDYTEFLLGLKGGDRDRVRVFTLVGERAYLELATGDEVEVTYTPDSVPEDCQAWGQFGTERNRSEVSLECCPEGVCPGQDNDTCLYGLGAAYSGARYLELAESLGQRSENVDDVSVPDSICSSDLGGPLSDLVAWVDTPKDTLCLGALPVCETVTGGPCVTEDERAEPANYGRSLTGTLACESAGCVERFESRALATDDLTVERDPNCPHGLVVRGQPAWPSGSHVVLTYPAVPDDACGSTTEN